MTTIQVGQKVEIKTVAGTVRGTVTSVNDRRVAVRTANGITVFGKARDAKPLT